MKPKKTNFYKEGVCKSCKKKVRFYYRNGLRVSKKCHQCQIKAKQKANEKKYKEAQKQKAWKKKPTVKKKLSPNSSYWRKKADDLFMPHFRGKPCAICGTTYKTCGHHLLPKGMFKLWRFEKMNILVVCPKHHTRGLEIAPHSDSFMAIQRFTEWVKKNRPEQYKWVIEHENCKDKPKSFKESFEELQDKV